MSKKPEKSPFKFSARTRREIKKANKKIGIAKSKAEVIKKAVNLLDHIGKIKSGRISF